jgi:hypothetical protein
MGEGQGREAYDFLAASRSSDAQMNEIAANNLQRQESRIVRAFGSRKVCKVRRPRRCVAVSPDCACDRPKLHKTQRS